MKNKLLVILCLMAVFAMPLAFAVVNPAACTDSDGGQNFNVKGYVSTNYNGQDPNNFIMTRAYSPTRIIPAKAAGCILLRSRLLDRRLLLHRNSRSIRRVQHLPLRLQGRRMHTSGKHMH